MKGRHHVVPNIRSIMGLYKHSFHCYIADISITVSGSLYTGESLTAEHSGKEAIDWNPEDKAPSVRLGCYLSANNAPYQFNKP